MLGHAGRVPPERQEPMRDKGSTRKVPVDSSLRKDINQLERFALGEGAVTCLDCDEEIPEGSSVAVYAFRPAGASHWRVGHCKCDDYRPQTTENFTLGVRELLVDGRVGIVIDQASQSHWPVLLAPRVRSVSPESTTDVIAVRGRPPNERKSRLARGLGPATIAERHKSTTSPEDTPSWESRQTNPSSEDTAETGPTQLTFGDLVADGAGADP